MGVEGREKGRGKVAKGRREEERGRERGREKEGVVARINGCQLLSHFSDYA